MTKFIVMICTWNLNGENEYDLMPMLDVSVGLITYLACDIDDWYGIPRNVLLYHRLHNVMTSLSCQNYIVMSLTLRWCYDSVMWEMLDFFRCENDNIKMDCWIWYKKSFYETKMHRSEHFVAPISVFQVCVTSSRKWSVTTSVANDKDVAFNQFQIFSYPVPVEIVRVTYLGWWYACLR